MQHMSLRRVQPVWRWVIILLVVAGLLFFGFVCWMQFGPNSFNRRVAAIRAAGDPTSIAELAPKPISSERNAASQLAAVAPQFAAFGADLNQFYNSPVGQAYQELRDRGEPPTAMQLAAIRAIVDKYPELPPAIDRAVDCEVFASALDYSLPPPQFIAATSTSMGDVRTVARFLHWRMAIAIADRRADDAVTIGCQLLTLARLYESEPGVIHMLVSMALRGMAAESLARALTSGEVAAERHAELDRELALHEQINNLTGALTSERAISIDMLKSHIDAGGGVLAVISPMKLQTRPVLDFYDAALPLVERPWFESHTQLGRVNAQLTQSKLAVMAESLAPSIQAAFDASNRTLAVMRSLRVLNALQQFATKNQRPAKGLEDLALPKGSTIDPFTGKPVLLKQTADGWIVYSVHRNGVDDGGRLADLEDAGVGPPSAYAKPPASGEEY